MTKPILVNLPFFHLFWVWGDEIELRESISRLTKCDKTLRQLEVENAKTASTQRISSLRKTPRDLWSRKSEEFLFRSSRRARKSENSVETNSVYLNWSTFWILIGEAHKTNECAVGPKIRHRAFELSNLDAVGKDGNTVWYVGTVRLNFCYEMRYAGTVRFL